MSLYRPFLRPLVPLAMASMAAHGHPAANRRLTTPSRSPGRTTTTLRRNRTF